MMGIRIASAVAAGLLILAYTFAVGSAKDTGGPAVVDPTSFGHFETQEDAQESFGSGDLPDPGNLDADGDGIACEIRWGEAETDSGGEVVALPDTGTGTAAQ